MLCPELTPQYPLVWLYLPIGFVLAKHLTYHFWNLSVSEILWCSLQHIDFCTAFTLLVILVGCLSSFSLTIYEPRLFLPIYEVEEGSISALVQPFYPALSKVPQNFPITVKQKIPQVHLIIRITIHWKKSFQRTNLKAWCWTVIEQEKKNHSISSFSICNIQ